MNKNSLKGEKMKKILILFVAIVMLSGCAKEEVKIEEKIRAVEVVEIKKETSNVEMHYMGSVNSKDITKVSFKSPGKIKTIFVEVGDEFKKGDKLISLDKEDLKLQVDAAAGQMEAAYSVYEKALNGATKEEKAQVEADVSTAKKAYEYISKVYADTKILYDKGAVSKLKYDEIELNYTKAKNTLEKANEGYKRITDGARKEDIEGAKSNYEAAKAAYNIRKSLLKDSTIYAREDGVVVEVLNEEFENVAAGYPVLLTRTNSQIVNVGIAQKDLPNVKEGTKAIIEVDGRKSEGEIVNIDEMPDMYTRMYNAEVKIYDDLYHIGSIAKVVFIIGEEEAVLINISAVSSNGIDYVYTVEDNRAVKKEIEIEDIKDDKLKILGLEEGEKVVIKGVKNLTDGVKVNVIGDEVEDEKIN